MPFYRVGDEIEAQYVEDQQWYRAVVDDRPNPNTYVVSFVDYGNSRNAQELFFFLFGCFFV
jgi:hypothetical protein